MALSFSNFVSVHQQVAVETQEKGFLITVFSTKSCPGLLVSILEVFEELGLTVMEARVSCADSFRLEAVGGEVRKGKFIAVLLSTKIKTLNVDLEKKCALALARKQVLQHIMNFFHHHHQSIILPI